MGEIKIPKLAGSANWDIWSIRIESLLVEKGYYNVMSIDPTSIENNADYVLQASKALAYIRLALADGPLLQTRYITNPYILWNSLKNLYQSKGFNSEFLICKELFNTTLTKSKNLEDYITTVKRLNDDLKARNMNLPDKFIAAWTLNNLTSNYENIVTIITQTINRNETIDLEELFAQLIDESRRFKPLKNTTSSSSKNEDTDMALNTKYSKSKSNSNNKSKKDLKCNFCGLKYHTESTCFKKHPELKKNSSVNNSNLEDNTKEDSSFISLETPNLVNNTTNTSSINWILDSSATTHICSIKDLFT